MAQAHVEYRFSVFCFSPSSGELTRKGGKLRLYYQAAQALTVLLQAGGQIVARKELESVLWPDGTPGASDRGVNRIISYLRSTLTDDSRNPRFIETLPKRGYRFCGQIEVVAIASPEVPEAVSTAVAEPEASTAELVPSMLVSEFEEHSIAAEGEEYGSVVTEHSALQQSRWFPQLAYVGTVLGVFLSILLASKHFFFGAKPHANAQTVIVNVQTTTAQLKPVAHELETQIAQDLNTIPGLTVSAEGDSESNHAPQAGYHASVWQAPGSVQAAQTPLYLITTLAPSAGGYHLTFSVSKGSSSLEQPQQYEFSENQFGSIHKAVFDRFFGIYLKSTGDSNRAGKATDDLAYSLYLRAAPLLATRTEESTQEAVSLLHTAVSRDPGFAEGKARLALGLMLQTYYQWQGAPADYRHAVQLANAALTVDPNIAEAHAVLGYVAMHQDWNFRLAERELSTSVELDESNPQIRSWLAILLSFEGAGAEGLDQLRLAQEQDPDSNCLIHNEVLLLSNAGRLPEMLSVARKATKRFPSSATIKDQYAWALWYNHEYAQAVEAWAERAHLAHDVAAEHFETSELPVLRANGVKVYAEAKLKALQSGDLQNLNADDAEQAQWYVLAGKTKEALLSLEESYKHQDPFLFSLKVDPVFASLHNEPRYQALLAKMHLDHQISAYSNASNQLATIGHASAGRLSVE